MKMMQRLLLVILFFVFAGVSRSQDTVQRIVHERVNARQQLEKPYVILISADGFRHDYLEKYHPEHLNAIAAEGVRAASLVPSFPSLTFPNHYSIVTGMYPAHHGLINNTMYDAARKSGYAMSNKEAVRDGSWYGGIPLWVLAEQQQMISASMFWVGSEAAVQQTRPTYYYNFNDSIPLTQRLETIRQWLALPEEKRPHLITFYLSETDHAGHMYGPDAPETAKAVQTVDSVVNALTEIAEQSGLPVNFIFLADHGMTAVNREHPIPTPSVIDRGKFLIPTSGTMMVVHAKDTADIRPLYDTLRKQENHYRVYLKQNMPPEYHYSATDDLFKRMGDIMLIPEWPYVFSDRKPNAGYHGFPPTEVKDMHATFIAWGPAFKKKLRIPAFGNVHIYPLIAEILGLRYTHTIDGQKKVLQGILK